jgi:hypothetical protein
MVTSPAIPWEARDRLVATIPAAGGYRPACPAPRVIAFTVICNAAHIGAHDPLSHVTTEPSTYSGSPGSNLSHETGSLSIV